ncbi:MAG: hypothetical protein NC421_06680, partial [Lachnospiraceae bacterium]|nr:hypothetical protein [Lachnospiraceae bacterium]
CFIKVIKSKVVKVLKVFNVLKGVGAALQLYPAISWGQHVVLARSACCFIIGNSSIISLNRESEGSRRKY